MSGSGSGTQGQGDAEARSRSGATTANIETGAGVAAEVEQPADAAGAIVQALAAPSPAELIERLEAIRARVMPILEAARREYSGRVRAGHPVLIDNVARGGIFGMTLDPGWGVYIMTDGERLYAELHRVSLRSDTLSAANAEKFAGSPVIDQREIDESWNDHTYRNLVSELLSKWNYQQLRIYRVDS
jgi:hypothetical protein